MGIGARNHPEADVVRFVEIFVATPFSQVERHKRRIALVAEYEATGRIAGQETT
jgi:ribose 5-phosphate isomerase B